MAELSAPEIADVRERLSNEQWRARMHDLQTIVYTEFEALRQQTETLTVRAVLPRTQLKQLGKVIAKIERNREDGNEAFGFDDIDDFVGIKVLCPYSSDVDVVIEWMLDHSGFVVKPRDPEQARRRRQAGYRGFHFTVALTADLVRRHADLQNLRCEVQVKTMLEEAWDAKTHDIQYRREGQINPTLIAQMRLLSDALEVLDRQSELLKQQIIETELDEAKRKLAVVLVYLQGSQDELRQLVDGGRISPDVIAGRISDADAQTLSRHVSENRGVGRATSSICRLAAILAIQARGQRFDVVALDVCDEYVRSRSREVRAHMLKGSVCWALDRLDEAISASERAVALAEEQHDEGLIADAKANLAYWFAERIWQMRRRKQAVPDDIVGTARAHIGYALEQRPESPAILDTAGFLRIVASEAKEDVERGRQEVKRAAALAVGGEMESIATAFAARHDRIGLSRLLELS